jgi:hypothetical protein
MMRHHSTLRGSPKLAAGRSDTFSAKMLKTVGLFIGPVVLAIGYQLFKAWVAEDKAPHKTQQQAETT